MDTRSSRALGALQLLLASAPVRAEQGPAE